MRAHKCGVVPSRTALLDGLWSPKSDEPAAYGSTTPRLASSPRRGLHREVPDKLPSRALLVNLRSHAERAVA